MAAQTGAPTQAPTKAKGPRTGVKIALLFISWILLAGIALQVLFVGLGFFYEASFFEVHIGFGYGFGHLGALLLIVGFFGRLGRSLLIVNIIDFVLFLVLPFLAGARAGAPIVAAIHPVVALTVFGLTLYLAIRLRALVPGPWGSKQAHPHPSGPAPMPKTAIR